MAGFWQRIYFKEGRDKTFAEAGSLQHIDTQNPCWDLRETYLLNIEWKAGLCTTPDAQSRRQICRLTYKWCEEQRWLKRKKVQAEAPYWEVIAWCGAFLEAADIACSDVIEAAMSLCQHCGKRGSWRHVNFISTWHARLSSLRHRCQWSSGGIFIILKHINCSSEYTVLTSL